MVEKVTWWRRRWVRNTALSVGGALVLFTVLGFFVVPPVARSIAETQASKQLGRKVSIGKIRLNPFALSLTVERLQIYEPDGTTPFVGFGKLYVNVQLASVYRLAPVVKEIRLESPRLRVVRTKESSDGFADLSAYNFSDILAKLNAEAAAAPPAKKEDEATETPRFSINNVHLLDGEITFDDRPTGGHHVISDLRVGVPFISTLPVDIDTFVVPGLAVRIDGTPFSIDGRTKPFKDSLETILDLRLNALDLAKYQPYVPMPLKFQLDSGLLTVALDLSFVRPTGGEPAVTVTGQIELTNLAARHRGKGPGGNAPAAGGDPAVHLGKLQVRLGKLDLTRMQFHVAAVRLAGLDVRAVRLANGTIDLQRWAPQSPEPTRQPKGGKGATATTSSPARAAAAKKSGPGPRFVVDDIKLDGINIQLRDETVRPAFQLAVRDLDVAVKHLSNHPGAQATMTVRLRAEPGGTTLAQKGTVTLEPLALLGEVKVEGLEPGRFAPYYADQIAFDINKGRVALGAGYRVASKGRQTSIALQDAFVELAEFKLRRRGASDDFLQLGALALRKVDVDVDAQKVAVGQVESHDVRVRAARDEKGVIDLTTLAGAAPPKTAAAPKPPATTAPSVPPADVPGPATAGPAWAVDVARVDLERWAARFDDRLVKPRALLAVDGLSVHARDLSTKPGSRLGFEVKLGLNKTGKIALAGNAVAEPLSADVQLDLKKIEILPFQPYFRDQANLLITDGSLSVKGRAKVDTPRHGAGKAGAAAPPPRVAFVGDVDIGEFAALDGRKNERLLAWKSFHVGGIDVVSEPMALAIKQVALSDFKARLIIFPDAHFNLQDIAVADPAAPPAAPKGAAPAKKPAAATAAAAQPAPKITIAEVTLQGGDVAFTDRLIQPNYSTELTELGGRITGLSAEANTTAEVALRGAIDHSGTLTIDGRVNPLAKDLFVDLKVDLKEFELPPTSPYAGRYAGYGIDKGKMAISLDYHVAGGKLDAKNRLTLDQFTFGEKVNSPDALKLPVKLAVALLKDRHGVIDIDLPISGSLDDPQFKLGRLILKTLGNLIVKAVTAPFSLIAKAFGGGDEQSFVEFPQGAARLEGKALDKVKAVGRALHERPGLSFEIEGQVDPQKDSPGLRQELYDRKLRGQKIKSIVEGGGAAPANETVQIAATERPRLIEAVYRTETFPKPRKPDGGEKTLPAAEMEKLILANARVQPDDLRQLALRRANAVKEALVKAAPEAAARVFLVSPRTTSPGNRVDLKLKQD